MAVHERDVHRLPLAGGLLGGRRGLDAAVDGAHVVRVERLAVAVHHLDLVNAAEVDAAVASWRHADLQREVEVLELPVGAQVAVVLVRLAFLLVHIIDQDAVLHAPAADGVRVGQPPAGEVLAVEEADGLAELHLAQVRRRRHRGLTPASEVALSAPLPFSRGVSARELELVALHGGCDRFGPGALDRLAILALALEGMLAGHDELAVLHLGRVERHHAAAAPKQAGLELAIDVLNAQPAGTPAGDGQLPSSQERVVSGQRGGAQGRHQTHYRHEHAGGARIHCHAGLNA